MQNFSNESGGVRHISQAEAAEMRCISRLNGKDNQEWENRVLQRRVLVELSSRVEYRV